MGIATLFTIFLLLSPSFHSKDVPVLQCTVNKDKCMTCMWNQHGTPSENYSLIYWYSSGDSSSPTPCSHYLQDNGINIGCWFNSSVMFRLFTVMMNCSDKKEPIIQTFENLQNLVKLDPPYSLKINSTDNNELLLKWQQDSGLFPIHCMCFQVQHHNMASEQWRLKDVNSAQFSLPSFDPQQSYTFQVRSKLNNLCATTEMWSEWSEDITWGKTETMSVEPSRYAYVQSLIMYLMLPFVCLVLVLLLLTRVERIWVIFVPRIPNPGKKFEDLFKTYKGDFQEWLGISKEVVESLKHNYTEPLCSVSEDP